MTAYIDTLVLLYFLALNFVYGMLISLSVYELVARMASRLPEFDNIFLSQESSPPISILVPAFNEEASIVDSVRALMQLIYPSLNVIVINDGSTDETLQRLKERFELVPTDLVVRRDVQTQPVKMIYHSSVESRLIVVDKENGGKADALNVGINAARSPLVCCVDSDTILDRKALLRMIEPFLYYDDQVIAVGGTVRLANGCKVKDGIIEEVTLPKSWLARFQIVEYLRAFLFGRMGYNRLGGNLIISGAFGLFARDKLVEAGAYQEGSIGEDMELVVRLHKSLIKKKEKYRIVFLPDPVCYTEAPESLKILGKQRDRWHRGLSDTMMRHKEMLFNPAYGNIGLVVFPIYFFFEFLGPVVELFGYIYFIYILLFGGVDVNFTLLFFIVAICGGFLLSLQSIILDALSFNIYKGAKVRAGLILAAWLENFGYRQITLFYRLRGLFKFITGEKSWGTMSRKGFEKEKKEKKETAQEEGA